MRARGIMGVIVFAGSCIAASHLAAGQQAAEASSFFPNPWYRIIQPRSTAIGDFDGDGDNDLVTANEWSDDVSIFLGDGNGGFTLTSSLAVGDSP